MRSVARIMGLLAAAPSIAAAAGAAPSRPDRLSPELERVRRALDKYQDPVAAVHDGYFSTIGCVAYAKGGPGSALEGQHRGTLQPDESRAAVSGGAVLLEGQPAEAGDRRQMSAVRPTRRHDG